MATRPTALAKAHAARKDYGPKKRLTSLALKRATPTIEGVLFALDREHERTNELERQIKELTAKVAWLTR